MKNENLGGATAIELRNRINDCTTPQQLHECQKMRLNWIKALSPAFEARERIGLYFDRKAQLTNYNEFLKQSQNERNSI